MNLIIVLLLAAPAFAEDIEARKKELREMAEVVEQLTDGEYTEVVRAMPRGGNPRLRYFASRRAAAGEMYRNLAALELKQAGRTVPADFEAVAIDPNTLEKSSWFSDWSSRFEVRHRTAVAAVRGGRKLPGKETAEISKLKADLKKIYDRVGSEKLSGEELNKLHDEAAGILKKLADAYTTAAHDEIAGEAMEKAKEADAKAAAQAPAAPAGADLSPREIYQRAGPSVVLIIAGGPDGVGELGTGSLIGKGRVLTNAHVVVRDGARRPFESVKVYLKPSRVTGDPKEDLRSPIQAKVMRFDEGLDLAELELESAPDLPALELGDASEVQAGDPVVAIGHPEQGGLWTLTQGIVSTVVADLGGVKGKTVFQTDASINRGNSGGPLLDRRGRIIGVNTSMARKAADGLTITSVNFAVRSDVARRWLGGELSAPAVVAKAEEEPRPQPKPAAKLPSKPKIVTPVKPFKADDVIAQGIAEMEDLEREMRRELESR